MVGDSRSIMLDGAAEILSELAWGAVESFSGHAAARLGAAAHENTCSEGPRPVCSSLEYPAGARCQVALLSPLGNLAGRWNVEPFGSAEEQLRNGRYSWLDEPPAFLPQQVSSCAEVAGASNERSAPGLRSKVGPRT